MTRTKRQRNKWRIILLIEIIILALSGLTALYMTVVSRTPLVQFVNGMLSPARGSDNILSRRSPASTPYQLTNGEKYYKSLADDGNINVLVIGESGVCYDTMLIASIDQKDNTVNLINLPRDIYIDYSDDVIGRLKKGFPEYASTKGMFKINAAHTIGRDIGYEKGTGRFGNPEYDFTADLIQEVFGIHIDDFVYLKTSSISKVVDYFGGIDINVPYKMKYSDPTQDFSVDLEKGFQHLDGKQAEGFVRFREGYDEKGKYINLGDPERKKNQTAFVQAFIKQKMTIGNVGKFISIAGDLDQYLLSSISNATELSDYGKLFEKLYANKCTTFSEQLKYTEKDIDGVYYLKLKTET